MQALFCCSKLIVFVIIGQLLSVYFTEFEGCYACLLLEVAIEIKFVGKAQTLAYLL